MNPHLQRLYDIAGKPSRLIIGLMSGTSMDGLDIALCRIAGYGNETKLTLLNFETIAYTEDIKKEIKSIFAQRQIDLEKLCLLHPWLALQHAATINNCLKKWGLNAAAIDLVASHGQTIYHAPARLHKNKKFGNATLQIGDGDHLAVATGIITICDFRQKDIATGGEGAPLAIYGDRLLFGNNKEDRILLNIGGIANFTYLPSGKKINEPLCTDVGPGNTLMDAFVQEQFPGKYFDDNGSLAKSGSVNKDLLLALKDHPFFLEPAPKTTGPELFNLHYLTKAKQRSGTVIIPVEDTMATLNKFSADMIVAGIKKCIGDQLGTKIFSSGGGVHNSTLMEHLYKQLPGCTFHSTNELGIDPDAKEAVLFAVLANECVCGNISKTMGKISFPA